MLNRVCKAQKGATSSNCAISVLFRVTRPLENICRTIRAYVYDHRYESRMQTDLLRRAKHEFYSLGLLKAQEVSNEDSGRGVSE